MSNPTGNRRGAAIIWVALLMIVFIGLIGLACDVGYGLLVAHQLHNAADAAALAAAQKLKGTDADVRLAAIQVGAANLAAKAPVQLDSNDGNGPDGDVVLGRYNPALGMFTPTLESPNAVKVVARRTDGSLNGPLALLFGPIFGVATVNVSRSAISLNQGDTGAGLIALCGDCECALRMSGTPTLNLDTQCDQAGPGATLVEAIGPDR